MLDGTADEAREHDRGGERAPGRMRRRSHGPRRTDRAFNSAQQRWRHRFARQALADHAAQRLDAVPLGSQFGLGRKSPLQLERVRGVELAVDIGVNEQARVFVCCGHGLSVPMLAISRRRARASRDITVPIGTLVTSAISR